MACRHCVQYIGNCKTKASQTRDLNYGIDFDKLILNTTEILECLLIKLQPILSFCILKYKCDLKSGGKKNKRMIVKHLTQCKSACSLCLSSSVSLLGHRLLCTHADWCCLLTFLSCVDRRWRMSKQAEMLKHRRTHVSMSVCFNALLRKSYWLRLTALSSTLWHI